MWRSITHCVSPEAQRSIVLTERGGMVLPSPTLPVRRRLPVPRAVVAGIAVSLRQLGGSQLRPAAREIFDTSGPKETELQKWRPRSFLHPLWCLATTRFRECSDLYQSTRSCSGRYIANGRKRPPGEYRGCAADQHNLLSRFSCTAQACYS